MSAGLPKERSHGAAMVKDSAPRTCACRRRRRHHSWCLAWHRRTWLGVIRDVPRQGTSIGMKGRDSSGKTTRFAARRIKGFQTCSDKDLIFIRREREVIPRGEARDVLPPQHGAGVGSQRLEGTPRRQRVLPAVKGCSPPSNRLHQRAPSRLVIEEPDGLVAPSRPRTARNDAPVAR
jgi:hypothetical protein